MKEFSIVDAAFYGFGFLKRAPMNFLGVVILLSVLMLGTFVLFLPAYADLLNTVMSSSDPESSFAAMGAFYASVGWYFLLALLVGMMAYGAINRALVFDPPPSEWILGIKIGGDELRLLWVYIAVSFLIMLGALVFGLLGGVIMGVAAASGSTGLAVVGAIVMYVLMFGVMIFLGVRFSPAAAATVGEKQIHIFRAWSMTKGKFWQIFLAYLILYVIIFVVYAVLLFGMAASFGLFGSGGAGFDPDSLRSIGVGPLAVVAAVVAAVVYTFIYGAFFGVGAYVYRQHGGGRQTAETFE